MICLLPLLLLCSLATDGFVQLPRLKNAHEDDTIVHCFSIRIHAPSACMRYCSCAHSGTAVRVLVGLYVDIDHTRTNLSRRVLTKLILLPGESGAAFQKPRLLPRNEFDAAQIWFQCVVLGCNTAFGFSCRGHCHPMAD